MIRPLRVARVELLFDTTTALAVWDARLATMFATPDSIESAAHTLANKIEESVALVPSFDSNPSTKHAAHDRFFSVIRVEPVTHARLLGVLGAVTATARLLDDVGENGDLSTALDAGLRIAAEQASGCAIPETPALFRLRGRHQSLAPMDRWVLGHHVFLVLVQAATVAHARCVRAVRNGELSTAAAAIVDAASVFEASGPAMRLASTMSPAEYTSVREAMTAPDMPPGFSGTWSADHQVLLHSLAEVRAILPSLPPPEVARWHRALAATYAHHADVCDQCVGPMPSLRMVAGRSPAKSSSARDELKSFAARALHRAGHQEVVS